MSKNDDTASSVSRRTLIKMGIVTGIAVPIPALSQPPNRMRPQSGDFIIFDEEPNLGELVRPEMLDLNQQPVSALAKDPDTDTVRDGSRLNRVMITRIDHNKLTERYRDNTADGVIAYSAICTHTGCDVINWDRMMIFWLLQVQLRIPVLPITSHTSSILFGSSTEWTSQETSFNVLE